MKKLIAVTASRSTYEDSLFPIVLHLARQVESATVRMVGTANIGEEDCAKFPDDKALAHSCERANDFARQQHSIATCKFKLAYQLAKLEHGEIALALGLANLRK